MCCPRQPLGSPVLSHQTCLNIEWDAKSFLLWTELVIFIFKMGVQGSYYFNILQLSKIICIFNWLFSYLKLKMSENWYLYRITRCVWDLPLYSNGGMRISWNRICSRNIGTIQLTTVVLHHDEFLPLTLKEEQTAEGLALAERERGEVTWECKHIMRSIIIFTFH
jgi:hypothetical protein